MNAYLVLLLDILYCNILMPYCDGKEIKMKDEMLCMYASLYADAYLILVFKLAKLNFGSMYGCTLQIKLPKSRRQNFRLQIFKKC